MTTVREQSRPSRTADLLRGVCPVLEVPFAEDDALDVAGFGAVVDHVLATGVSAVMFPGFASEFHKLSDAERRVLTGELLDRTRTRRDVAAIVSIPEHATRLAAQAARDAVAAGADALNVLPPHTLGPSRADVLAHLDTVLSAAGDTPVVVQYAPAQTGTSLDAADLFALAREHPNLARVKVESTPPGTLISALAEGSPPLASLVGYAGLLLPDALHRGAVGVQPGCSFTELYQAIWDHWQRDDTESAAALHRRMLPWLAYWMQHVELIVAAEKLISVRRGMIGSARCRAPRRVLDSEEVRAVDAFLVEFADLLPPVGR